MATAADCAFQNQANRIVFNCRGNVFSRLIPNHFSTGVGKRRAIASYHSKKPVGGTIGSLHLWF